MSHSVINTFSFRSTSPGNAVSPSSSSSSSALQLQVYNANGSSFHVNATLICGEKEAMLVDTGFTRADALRIASLVVDSGKTLTTIYISHADPDFFFGLDVLTRQFAQAKVVATAPTVKQLQAKWQSKIDYWGPKLGANAPQTVPIPSVLSSNTITLEGHTLEIRGLDSPLPHRSYVWIPSIKAIVGGVNIFAGLHAWTADTPTAKDRANWIALLSSMLELNPVVVVPGHSLSTDNSASQIVYTRDYLTRFEEEKEKASNAASLIAALTVAYPNAGLAIAIDLGAKVATGELKW